MKVLIADDDRVFTHSIGSRLRAKGWTVEVAHDAMQALAQALRGQPEVIVLDISLPAGTGFQVLTKLRASTRTGLIPVVMVTGGLKPDDEATAREYGAADFFRKPVDPQALHEVLSRLVEGHA